MEKVTLKRYPILVGLFLLIIILLYSCSLFNNIFSALTGKYKIQGQFVSAKGISPKAGEALSITHICAIGTDGQKYLADYDSDKGTFSIEVDKGHPYAVGFYNKSNGKITLLGLLKQKDLGWDSLPLINPKGDSLDLGSVDLDNQNAEASASISLNNLIDEMNMDLTTARYYGKLDDPVTIFTNIDVNGNGEFDFEEDKSYTIGFNIETDEGTGQIANMLNGSYNESYIPNFINYATLMTATDDPAPQVGTSGTITFPATVTSDTESGTYFSGETFGSNNSWGFQPNFGMGNAVTDPPIPPSGTYIITVNGKGTYTFNNVQGTEVAQVGVSEGVIYPVFNIITDADGYITTLNYKWKIIENGTPRSATSEEVEVAILDTDIDPSEYTGMAPYVQFWFNNNSSSEPIKISRDGSSASINTVDIIGGTSQRIKLSDVKYFQAATTLSSFVVCKFSYSQ